MSSLIADFMLSDTICVGEIIVLLWFWTITCQVTSAKPLSDTKHENTTKIMPLLAPLEQHFLNNVINT